MRRWFKMCNCEIKDYCCENGCCGTHDIFEEVNEKESKR